MSDNLRTPLSKAKGLGSANDGVEHFWVQRLTALALIPITLWFCFSVASLPNADYAAVAAWLSSPFNAAMMIITVIISFHHAQLGLQVIIEDYVSCHAKRTAAIIAVKFGCFLFGVIGVVSVLKVAIGA